MAANLLIPNNKVDIILKAKQAISKRLSTCMEKLWKIDFSSNTTKNSKLLNDSWVNPKPRHGEISIQFFRFAKQFKMKPAESTSLIADEFRKLHEIDQEMKRIVCKVEVVDAYLNFFLKIDFLSQIISISSTKKFDDKFNSQSQENFFSQRSETDFERVMIEFSQPNTHKVFHVGHMRNVALGDSLVRIYRHLGYDVVPVNYYGDEGAHVAKCLWFIEKFCKIEDDTKNNTQLDQLMKINETERADFLGACYTKSVELLELSNQTKFPFVGVVSAKILSIKEHPSNSSQKIVQVTQKESDSIGQTVVCGGTDYSVGDLIAYCPLNCRFGTKTIVEREMGGITSRGLILGQTELGNGVPKSYTSKISQDNIDLKIQDKASSKTKKKNSRSATKDKRIYILPPTTPLGIELAEHFSQNIDEFSKKKEENKDDILTKYLSQTIFDDVKKTFTIDQWKIWKTEVAQVLQRLEQKEPKIYELQQKTRQQSLDEFDRIYKQLDTRFEHKFYESQFSESSKKLVQSYYEKGVFIKNDNCIGSDLTKQKLGFCILLKSDGSGLYATKDIELACHKFDDYKIDRSIYVVDIGQSHHFQQVFATLKTMGYEKADKCRHLAYGLVILPSGKMSSRHGTIIVFSQLVNLLKENLRNIFFNDDKLKEMKGSNKRQQLSEHEIEKILHAVSVGTIKYGMLNWDISRDIVFNIDEQTNPQGNTGSYLMMQYTRIASIIREVPWPEDGQIDYSLLKHDLDRYMLSRIAAFQAVLEKCAESGSPMALCNYLYDLCKAFSSWYAVDQNSVKRAETPDLKKTRLAEIKCLKMCLQQGLNLLGIDVLERM